MDIFEADQDSFPALAWGMLAEALRASGLGGRLFAAGNPAVLEQPLAALAGSREAEGWALTALEALAGNLALEGLAIVSGGARGTDVAGHRGALQSGGSTVVIVPCALEDIDVRTWRAELARLWDFDRTLFLSPFPAGFRPARSSPILRNKLIAALAHAAVAGQTGLQSGTNHFISEVLSLDTPLFVLDTGGKDDRLAAAMEELHRRGASLFRAESALDSELARRIAVDARRQAGRRNRQRHEPGDLFTPSCEH